MKANTDRPVHSIDMKSDEPWSTISDLLDLKSISDLKGADVDAVAGFLWVLIDKASIKDSNGGNNGANNKNLDGGVKSRDRSFFYYRLDDFVNEKAGSIQEHKYTGDTTVKYSKGINGEKDTFFIKRTDNDK